MEARLADIKDLLKEQWLRKRNSGQIVWCTRDNKYIPIKDMTDKHLDNTIKMIQKNHNIEWEYFEALGSIGEID